jgi:hypothetical protein
VGLAWESAWGWSGVGVGMFVVVCVIVCRCVHAHTLKYTPPPLPPRVLCLGMQLLFGSECGRIVVVVIVAVVADCRINSDCCCRCRHYLSTVVCAA